MTAGIPKEEKYRLEALASYNILDSDNEIDFDEIVELASMICGTPISTITLIDKSRQWFKAKKGLTDSETSRDVAFCAHAILDSNTMIVGDATKDERFHNNPLVTGHPDIRFYAGVPLVNPEGYKLGTLCVIDTKPKTLTQMQVFALEVLSKQVMKQIELRKSMADLQKINEMNRKLLSVIGHDLRSPLASLYGLLELVENFDLSQEEFKNNVPKIRSSLTSADLLLKNLLAWATSHFDKHEMTIENFSLYTAASEVILAQRDSFLEKKNQLQNQIPTSLRCKADINMIKTVLRNLIQNANKFTQEGTISLFTKIHDNKICVAVSDTGQGIASDQLTSLFDWNHLKSTKGTQGEGGSGFGLIVCKEFIEKHGGEFWVESNVNKGSTFYFTVSTSD